MRIGRALSEGRLSGPSLFSIGAKEFAVAEQLQVDGIGHCSIAGIVWMQMVTTIERQSYHGRMSRIAYHNIKIEHRIEFVARSYPLIDGLTLGFAGRAEVRRTNTFKRCQGSTVDAQAAGVRASDICRYPAIMSSALTTSVGIKPPNPISLIPSNTVMNRKPGVARTSRSRRDKASKPNWSWRIRFPLIPSLTTPISFRRRLPAYRPISIGPAIVRIHRRIGSVGDQIAEGNNHTPVLDRADMHGREEKPGCRRRRPYQVRDARRVAARDIGRLLSFRMPSGWPRVLREIDADRQTCQVADLQVHRVTQDRRVGRYDDRRMAAEREYPI